MTVGIRIENDQGGIQVNEQLIAWGQVGTGSVTLVNDNMTHPQPIVVGEISVSGGFPVIAIRPRGGKAVGVTFVSQLPGGGYKYALMCQSNSNVTVDWWAFDSAANATKDPTMQSVNLVVKDEFGAVTFDASMPHLRVVAGLAPGMSSNPLGTDDHSTEASISTPSGKSYAVIISTIGHTATMYDTGNYSSGSPSTPPEESETLPGGGGGGPPMDASWREMVLKTYLGMVSFDGLTFRMGMTQFEVFQGWYPMGQTPHLIHHGSPSFTVIDVTGYGGGTGGGAPVIAVNVNNWTPTASGAAGSDIISPSVTASASGGVGPYYYQWYYDSGSTAVTYHSAADANPFQLRSPATPANTTRVARWRVKATDANGDTGWSEPVEFRFIGGAGPDYVPDAITPFMRLDVSSNDPDVSWSSGARQITGINQPINLRFERYNYTGNLSGLYIDVFTGPSATGPWTHHGYFSAHEAGTKYLDLNGVTDGTWIAYNPRAISSSGRRSATCTFTVWNLSDPGGSVKISDVTNNVFVVDADDNFNNADFTPNPVDWNNISGSTNDGSFFLGHNNQTISGINQPVTLRATISNVSASNIYLAGSRLDFWKNGSKAHDTSGIGNGYWTEATFTNGDYGAFIAHAGQAAVGLGTLSYTVTITNQSAGGVVLDTFTVNQTVDADYVAPDYTLNAISLPSLTLYTNDPSGYTNDGVFQVLGINQPVVLRFTRGNQVDSGGIFTRRLFIYHSTNGGASYVEYFIGAGTNGVLDLTVNNGDYILLRAYCDTNIGTGQTSFTGYIANQSTGGNQIASFNVSATVDADNNHNVPDYTMNVPSLSTISLYTNDPSGNTNIPAFQVTGIDQSVNLRFTRSGVGTGMTLVGNIIYSRQYIGHSTNGGASWTTYLLTAAAGAEVNITVNNGDYISYYGYIETSAGRASAAWYTDITNTSASQYLGRFNAEGTVDADNNYNVTPLAVSVANSYSYDHQFVGSGNYYEISAFSNPTVSGGTAPYTYKWTRLNGLVAIQSSTMLNPRFSYYARASWSAYSEYELEVTDAAGVKAYGYFTADWSAGDIEV